MGREILFRGKRADNGEWMEGYYAIIGKRKVIIAYPEMFYDENGKEVYANEIKDVDFETICRYTGLTDRNGRKIFEGDIVNCREKRGAAFWRCKVQWNETRVRFDVITVDCAFPMCLDGCGRDIPIEGSDYEVVGNIFDNPELMEGAVAGNVHSQQR